MDCVICVDKCKPRPSEVRREGAVARRRGHKFRMNKVLAIKRQLAQGRYRLVDKLDIVVERLLKDLP